MTKTSYSVTIRRLKKDTLIFDVRKNSDNRVTSRKIGKGAFVFDVCRTSDDRSGGC